MLYFSHMKWSYWNQWKIQDPVKRFWKYVKKSPFCWEWKGAKRVGYGTIRVNGKHIFVHRFSYELHFGKIPKGNGYHGTVILHKCDNRACVNPKHLKMGTTRDNNLDMWSKNRGRNQYMTHDRP